MVKEVSQLYLAAAAASPGQIVSLLSLKREAAFWSFFFVSELNIISSKSNFIV